MKYFIISDIHGSSYYFEKAMKFYDSFKCVKLLILGDLLYHGPRNDLPYGHDVKKLVKLLNERKDLIIAIKGNCDAEVDQMVLDFQIEDNMYLTINGRNVYLTHGHHDDIKQKFKKGTLVLSGHTHVYKFSYENGVYYFNPGSISLPKQNQEHTFAILENDEITLYDIKGNILNTYKLED